ncbi:MAG: hypothetical protein JO053_05365 [Acidobacteria bacterium]|nr:hypothetical protein [Acidobacteriota bacterium]
MNDPKELEFYESESVPDEEFQAELKAEIDAAPTDVDELTERLEENTAASPKTSGGDIDAAWEEANTSGSEAVFGDNPTPDQSLVEANAHAMGIDFQDNEPLDFVEKLEKRDRDRFELDEGSKTSDDMI